MARRACASHPSEALVPPSSRQRPARELHLDELYVRPQVGGPPTPSGGARCAFSAVIILAALYAVLSTRRSPPVIGERFSAMTSWWMRQRAGSSCTRPHASRGLQCLLDPRDLVVGRGTRRRPDGADDRACASVTGTRRHEHDRCLRTLSPIPTSRDPGYPLRPDPASKPE